MKSLTRNFLAKIIILCPFMFSNFAHAEHYCTEKLVAFLKDYDDAVKRVNVKFSPQLAPADPEYPYCTRPGDCEGMGLALNNPDPSVYENIETTLDSQVVIDYWNNVLNDPITPRSSEWDKLVYVESIAINPEAEADNKRYLASTLLNDQERELRSLCNQLKATSAAMKDLYQQEALWWNSIKDSFWIDFSSNYLKITGNAVLLITGVRELLQAGKLIVIGYKSRKVYLDLLKKTWTSAIEASGIPTLEIVKKSFTQAYLGIKLFCKMMTGDAEQFARCMAWGPFHVFVDGKAFISRERQLDYAFHMHGLRPEQGIIDAYGRWKAADQTSSIWNSVVKTGNAGQGVTEFFLDGQMIYQFPDVQNPFTPMMESTLSLYKKLVQSYKTALSTAQQTIPIYESATNYYNSIRAARLKVAPTCKNQFQNRVVTGFCVNEDWFKPLQF